MVSSDFNDTVLTLTSIGVTAGLAAGIVNTVDKATNPNQKKKKRKAKPRKQSDPFEIDFL